MVSKTVPFLTPKLLVCVLSESEGLQGLRGRPFLPPPQPRLAVAARWLGKCQALARPRRATGRTQPPRQPGIGTVRSAVARSWLLASLRRACPPRFAPG